MTHLLAAIRHALRVAFCSHPARTTRPLAVNPADGGPIVAWHCSTCKGNGVEYG